MASSAPTNSVEGRLADRIEDDELFWDDGYSYIPLADGDRDLIVAALRIVAEAKSEIICEAELLPQKLFY